MDFNFNKKSFELQTYEYETIPYILQALIRAGYGINLENSVDPDGELIFTITAIIKGE